MCSRRGKQAGPRAERGISVKTTVQGMPDDPAEPIATAACFLAARGPWVAVGTGVPCASTVAEGFVSSNARAKCAARMRSHVRQLFDRSDPQLGPSLQGAPCPS
jgi:hypothetical protein